MRGRYFARARDWQSSNWPEPATGSCGIVCASGGSSQSVTHSHDAAHVILGFSVGRDAVITRDRVRSRVIGSECKFGRAKLRQHHQKVAGGSIKVRPPVIRIYAELRGRRGHQLSKANRAYGTTRIRAIGAFDFDIGLEQRLPFGHRQTCAAQCRVPAIAMRGAFNDCEDFRAGNRAGGCRRRIFKLRRCEHDQLWRVCTNPVDIALCKTRLRCFGFQLAIGPHGKHEAFRIGGRSNDCCEDGKWLSPRRPTCERRSCLRAWGSRRSKHQAQQGS